MRRSPDFSVEAALTAVGVGLIVVGLYRFAHVPKIFFPLPLALGIVMALTSLFVVAWRSGRARVRAPFWAWATFLGLIVLDVSVAFGMAKGTLAGGACLGVLALRDLRMGPRRLDRDQIARATALSASGLAIAIIPHTPTFNPPPLNLQAPELVRQRTETALRLRLLLIPVAEAASLTDGVESVGHECHDDRSVSFGEVAEYAYECTVSLTRYYGFDGPFRPQALALDRAFRRLGWRQRSRGLTQVLTIYDELSGGPPPGNPAPPGRYMLSDLPSATYETGPDDVDVSFVEKATLSESVEKIAFSGNRLIKSQLRRHDAVVALRMRAVYYRQKHL